MTQHIQLISQVIGRTKMSSKAFYLFLSPSGQGYLEPIESIGESIQLVKFFWLRIG